MTPPINRPFSARFLRAWLPTPGNVVFTVIVVLGVVWAQGANALSLPATAGSSVNTIPYQGRLADADGNPLTDTYNVTFRMYNAATGGSPLWEEQWTGPNSVQVSDGLFNVMLGSLTPIPQTVITDNSMLFLGVTVGTDDEMSPRVQLGTVPFAVQALTVPDGSITEDKLAPEIDFTPSDGSITTSKLADGAVTPSKMALPNGKVCMPENTTISVPGSNSRVPIPNMSLSLTLDTPAQLLVWTRGAQHFDSEAYIGMSVFLNETEILFTTNLNQGSWDSIASTELVSLSAGEHALDLRTWAQEAGTMSYRYGCLEYVVISGS